MGLIVLILVGILPGAFALNPEAGPADIQHIVQHARDVEPMLLKHSSETITSQEATDQLSAYLKTKGVATEKTFAALDGRNREVAIELEGRSNFSDVTVAQRKGFRSDIYLLSETINKLLKQHKISDPAEAKALAAYQVTLQKQTKYIPTWVKFAVALALGLGTMIGWKPLSSRSGKRSAKSTLPMLRAHRRS